MESRTVVFSPIRQAPKILSLFLRGLEKVLLESGVRIWFYDDNDSQDSRTLLENFRTLSNNVSIINSLCPSAGMYVKNENTHIWNDQLVDRIISIKNNAIELFLQSDYDAIFLVDSDLILHPQTIKHLQSLDLPIVSEVFWTKFSRTDPYKPNVWDIHSAQFKSAENLLRLREHGVYEVGGLGACTLIQREPLERGVNFSRVMNLDFWGEDRHFCTRASCLGYQLFADTNYPPFHVYRSPMLEEATSWFENGCAPDYFSKWLGKGWEADIQEMFLPKKQSFLSRIFRRLASLT